MDSLSSWLIRVVVSSIYSWAIPNLLNLQWKSTKTLHWTQTTNCCLFPFKLVLTSHSFQDTLDPSGVFASLSTLIPMNHMRIVSKSYLDLYYYTVTTNLLNLVAEFLPLTTLRNATTASVKRYTPYYTTAVAESLILEIHCMIFGQTKCKKLMTTENFVSENGERHMDSRSSTTGWNTKKLELNIIEKGWFFLGSFHNWSRCKCFRIITFLYIHREAIKRDKWVQ